MKNSHQFIAPRIALNWLLLLVLAASAGCSPIQSAAPVFKCGDGLGCITIAPGAALKLGALYTLSGGASPGGIEQLRTVQMVIGGRGSKLLGHPIDLHVEDELCTPEGGANGALRIVADPQVVAIFGTNCSGAAVTAAKIISDKGMVMISGSNTSPLLTGVGNTAGKNWVPGYYRTAWNDSVMGKAAALFAYNKLHIGKAAVVNSGDAYSKGLTDAFTQAYNLFGGNVVLDSTINEDESDDSPLLTAVAQSEAELLFFPLSQPEAGSRIIREAKTSRNFESTIFIGGEGMLSEVFIKRAGQAGAGVYILGPATPSGDENAKIKEKYKALYGENPPSFYYTFTYDAVNLMFDTIEKIAVQDTDGTLHVGRQALRDALYATHNYKGLTGLLNCNHLGDCGDARLDIMRLDNPAAGVDGLKANVIFSYNAN